MNPLSFLIALLSLTFVQIVRGATVPSTAQQVSLYAPQTGACPGVPLVRPANGLSSEEQDYIHQRRSLADQALLRWLNKVSPGGWNATQNLPMIAHSSSGGGFRALLTGAGVIKALDERDSISGIAGLYQACTYHTALSGGSWLLASLIGNDWPTVTSLRDNLWTKALSSGLWFAGFSWKNNTFWHIIQDLIAKGRAGFDIVFNDAWGRLLSDIVLLGDDGGVSKKLSDVASYSNMTSHAAPFPIMLSLGVNTADGQCFPSDNATIYEFSPYEFGSWDAGVAAFTPTKYMGTSGEAGHPLSASDCVTGFDNLGYVLGASSTLFNDQFCAFTRPGNLKNATSNPVFHLLWSLVSSTAYTLNLKRSYATIPNPFRNRDSSPLVASFDLLTLVDGAEANTELSAQNDPLWPLIQPQRGVSVVLASDNSADTKEWYPNGEALRKTAAAAAAAGFGERMPSIPDADTYIRLGLNKKVTLFGCRSPQAVTIVSMPNTDLTFPSGQSTLKMKYTPAETEGMIGNGEAIANANGAPDWPQCLACGIMAKSGAGAGPDACAGCLDRYCYN